MDPVPRGETRQAEGPNYTLGTLDGMFYPVKTPLPRIMINKTFVSEVWSHTPVGDVWSDTLDVGTVRLGRRDTEGSQGRLSIMPTERGKVFSVCVVRSFLRSCCVTRDPGRRGPRRPKSESMLVPSGPTPSRELL